MEQNKIENQTEGKISTTATFIDARVALSHDGQFVLHFLADGTILRKSINLYKHVMKLGYQKRTAIRSPLPKS